jgi:regulator of nucleoside diphosphate kinase
MRAALGIRLATHPVMTTQYNVAKKRARSSRHRRPKVRAIISTQDRRRLGSLIADDDCPLPPGAAQSLETKLEEAVYVEQSDPRIVVTMHTTVELVDVSTGESRVATLVYPDEAEFIDDSVSVLAPLGIALLGSAVGSVVQCGPSGARLKIVRIVN